ncbi:uncharacterized protein LOC112688756 [Sipha flava]|uniref:Uncharacterized protein LOC112688756 n=1 Tax=Sipha flava TaxID=143950 RepID=A0A8B8G4Z4_9HEMI|nr:uncharacterized protein LOC112688756 [Sipha flava]
MLSKYLEENIPVERFVVFMPNQGHKAKDMFKGLDTFLKENNLDIKNCRGQSYDNASSMSGKYNGLQAYKVLTNCLKRAETENPILIPKRTKTTRWSCRSYATKALLRGYKKIKNALLEISENKEELGKSRIVALSLYNKMLKIQTGLYANLRLDVNTAVLTLKSPRSFIGTTRDSFEGYFVKVAELDDFVEYDSETQRKRKINVRLSPLESVQPPEIEVNSSNKFQIQNFLPDQLESSLQQRLEPYELVDNRFGFLYNFKNVPVTMVSNSSGERSFSKLKLIKNRLRTSMTEEKLNTLALLSIESDTLRQINYEDIISDFINTKLRRKLIKI